MAIKVTGLFQSPQSNLIYESPILGLIPHLEYPGVLNLEVRIFPTGSLSALGGIKYDNINYLNFNNVSGSNSYDSLIYNLETYVITNLSEASFINSQSTFERFTP